MTTPRRRNTMLTSTIDRTAWRGTPSGRLVCRALPVAMIALGDCRSGTPGAAPAPRASRVRHEIANTDIRVLPPLPGRHQLQLHVGLPDSYAREPARRYPVLYLCDGYWDFALLTGIRGNLVYDKAAPEMIIVGLGYAGDKPDYGALRRYDYTPVPHGDDKAGATSGHAAEFLAALDREIIPFIEKEYRVDRSYRVLGGSSLGGLFALYAMLERPDLFQGIIAPSPAVDWPAGGSPAGSPAGLKDRWLFGREAALASRRSDLPVRLFISAAGEEDQKFLAAIKEFSGVLQGRHYRDLEVRWRVIDGERHAGTKAESYNRGVRFAFSPRAPSPLP